MQKININEFLNILDISLNSDMNIKPTLCLWGKHGMGKTKSIENYAKEKDIPCVPIPIANFSDMGDFLGMPFVENGKTKYVVPSWVPTSEGPGILLLDDFNRADRRILNGIMQLIQDHRTVAWSLPKGWMIVCTANNISEGYSVTNIDSAQHTRMANFEVRFDVDAWKDYLIRKNYDKDLTYYFFTEGEDLINKNSKDINPRTVENFLQHVNDLDKSSPDYNNTVATLAGGYMGDVVAISIASFLIKGAKDLPNIKKLYEAATPEEFWKIMHEKSRVFNPDLNENMSLLDVVNYSISKYFLHLESVDKFNPNKVIDNLTSDEMHESFTGIAAIWLNRILNSKDGVMRKISVGVTDLPVRVSKFTKRK